MSLFAKTGPWIAASLCAVASVFGQNCEPKKCEPVKCEPVKCKPVQCAPKCCDPVPEITLMPGYNQCARIDVRCSWDVFATASFTYWQPVQDNMELGIVSDNTVVTDVINGNVVNMDFDYKPGFKVGLGMNFDHDCWDTFVEYTWFRGSHSNTTTLNAAEAPNTTLFPMWSAPSSLSFYSGSQKWKLHMDLLDWQLGREYYVGTKLTYRPFFAARAAWIRQNLDVDYLNDGAVTPVNDFVNKTSNSWAIGPRAGLYTNWMIGDGFRLYGNGAGDILFTQYTKLNSKETVATNAGVVSSFYSVKQRKLNTIRTHLDLELGLGWGSYFDCNNWHVDFTAGYGFQVFFDQNMFRHFTDDVADAVSNTPNGNLYMHGLTATARLDF